MPKAAPENTVTPRRASAEAKSAVEDLRGVIKALRVDDRVDPRASIEEHIERARAAGTKVRYEKGDVDKLSTIIPKKP